MGEKWKIQFWGTRGSMTAAGSDFFKYGGNTSCTSVDWGEGLVVFDGGSGLVHLGRSLAEQRETRRVDLLLSHMHMDHIVGLLGFGLFHDPRACIHLYGEAGEGGSFRERLETVTGRPYWPVGFHDFSAEIHFHEIRAGEVFWIGTKEDGICVRTLRGKHPGGSILYRLDGREKSVVYGLDCQLDGEIFEQLADFSRDTQVLICDANFTQEDLRRYPDWGHSSWQQGIALRRAANAGKAVMTHFAWEYTDEFLTEQERLVVGEDPASLFARERMELWV